ncbi:MAG: ParB/RepB/Spo0J family partition protein [Patescibacteria group bacterium]|nr:ParB/RepB/Spo0J family partition protein [Patescibacteria group bacterium]
MSLGRGLSSLIPSKTTVVSSKIKSASSAGTGVLEISPSKITPNPSQPRKIFSHKELEELVKSIKQYGILQPLLVSDLGGGRYELIAGERRLRAAKIAGVRNVPIILKSINAQKKLELALVENLHREDLNPIEEARAYKGLIDEFSLRQEDVAKKMSKSRPQITNTLRLLNLPEGIQSAIQNKKIPATSARALVTMTPKEQELYLKRFLKGGMTTSDIERESRLRKKTSVKSKDANTLALEETLREILETKVVVKKRGQRGQITIDFYSDEEFKTLVKKLKSI